MIHIENIDFSYSNEKKFIENLNEDIPKGKVTTIIGPNGSGKSTLLSLISRLNKPRNGTVYIDNLKINDMRHKEIAKKVATVYQHNQSPEHLTVSDLVAYGRTPHKKYFQGETKDDLEIIDWAIKSTNLHPLKDKMVSQLSGGERQRVWIAMALAQKPKLLLLDEPTTYLDIFHQMEILELVKKLNEEYKITVVMVLHDINQAFKYSDYMVIMKNGFVVNSGEPKDILDENLLRDVYKVNGSIRTCPVSKAIYFVPLNVC